jgi:hypothetical protein
MVPGSLYSRRACQTSVPPPCPHRDSGARRPYFRPTQGVGASTITASSPPPPPRRPRARASGRYARAARRPDRRTGPRRRTRRGRGARHANSCASARRETRTTARWLQLPRQRPAGRCAAAVRRGRDRAGANVRRKPTASACLQCRLPALFHPGETDEPSAKETKSRRLRNRVAALHNLSKDRQPRQVDERR